jgi:hypothetical protein
MLLGGGNIEPVEDSTSTIDATSTSSSTSTPSLPNIAVVEGISDASDLVYKERTSQLLWQDEIYTEEETGAFKNEQSIQKAGNFSHAKQYCESLDYAGFLDWRLPSSEELMHVYYYNGKVFSNTRDNDFWSSSPATRDRYYIVFPSDSMRYARSPRQSNFIRCVRNIID